MAEQAPTFTPAQQNAVRTHAWTVLFTFFAFFCSFVALGGYFGLRYYTDATVPVDDTRLLKYVNTGVLMKQPDLAVPQDVTALAERPKGCRPTDPTVCVPFSEGQQLVGRRGAGFGPVAGLRLPDSSLINLFTQPAGFDITLKKYQVSRWTDESQVVVLSQKAGYARYDIATGQPYKHISYTVEISPGVNVQLEPGGSYSINVPRDEAGKPRGRLITDPPIMFEIAVRKGRAFLSSASEAETVEMRRNDLVQVALNGTYLRNDSNVYQTAQWEMLPDGTFSAYTTAQYNDPKVESTWKLRSYDDSGSNAPPGEFLVVRTCPPLSLLTSCSDEDQINYGEFRRQVGDGKPFSTGIDNAINADVSEYTQSLLFKMYASVLPNEHSVKNTGDRGAECPIVVTFTYKMRSPTDADQFYKTCIFTGDGSYATDSGINRYIRMKPFGVYPVSFDLRQLPPGSNSLREAWYISNVRIEARGHDYLSQVTEVSLVGK